MPPLEPGALVVSIERSGRPDALSFAVVDRALSRAVADAGLLERREFLAERQDALLRLRLRGPSATAPAALSAVIDRLGGFGFSTGCCCELLLLRLRLQLLRAGAGGRGRSSIIMRTTRSGTSTVSSARASGRSISGNTNANSMQKSSETASDLRIAPVVFAAPRPGHRRARAPAARSISRSMIHSCLRRSSSSWASNTSSSIRHAWNSCSRISSTSTRRRSSIPPTRFWNTSTRLSRAAHLVLGGASVASPQNSPAPPVSRSFSSAPHASDSSRAARAPSPGPRAPPRPRAGRVTRPSSFSRTSASCGASVW